MTTEPLWKSAPVVETNREPLWKSAPPVAEEGQGVMPFVNRGIATGLGMPADMIQKGLNLIPGVELAEPFMGSKSIENAMEFYGIKLPGEKEEPKTIAEYAGRGVGEVAGALPGLGGIVGAVAKTGGVAGRIATTMISSMRNHPYLTMAGEVTGGMGAGVGRGVAEKSTESPMAKTLAEMGGGIAGGMLPTVSLYAPTAVLLRQGKNILKKISLPFTETGAKYRAGKYVKGLVADPQTTAQAIKQPTIGDLPPAIRSGENRLIQLYKNFIGQDPLQDAEAIETIGKSIVRLEKEMRKIGYGSPDLLAEITRKRIAAIELGMDKKIMVAVDNANTKLTKLAPAQRTVNESNIVRSELEKAMYDARKAVGDKWKNVPKGLAVGVENTRSVYGEIVSDLGYSQRVDIPTALKTDPIITGKKLKTTTLKQMQGLRSKLLETARIARKDGQWNKARIAGEVADAILADLDAVSGTGVESLKVALAATKQFKTRFESGIVGKVLGYSKAGAPAIPSELTLDISIGRAGTRGSVDFEKIVVTPEAMEAAKKYLTRSYTDYATDAKTGMIDPIKSERWIKNNESVLDKVPGLGNQLKDAGQAQKIAIKTKNIMEARKRALRDPKISTAARFLNTQDLGLGIDAVFKSKNPSVMTKELIRQAQKDGSGDALAGLKSGFVDYIIEKSSIGPYNDVGEQTLSGKTIMGFLNKNKSIVNEVFSPPEMARIKKVANELGKTETFKVLQAKKPDVEMKDFASTALKLFSRVGGAQIGRWVARMTGGGTVQTPGIFSDRFKMFANFLSKDRAFQMIHDAITSKDPKLLEALLLPLEKPGGGINTETMKILDARINAWLIGTGSRVMEDIEEEIRETTRQ